MAAERQAAARQWWQSAWVMLAILSLGVGLLAGAVVALYAKTRPAVYESSATLLIDQSPAVFETGDEGLLGKLSRLRFKYVGLVGTTLFAETVADDAGLATGDVRAGLSASADLNTLLLVVTSRMHDAIQAHQVAQTAADDLVSYVHNEQFDAKIPQQDQVTFSVVSPATRSQQVEPSTKKVLLEGVVVFLVISVLGALGADLLRRRVTGPAG